MNPVLPANRAFLIWLSDEVDPSASQLSGRIEHVKSGRRARFNSDRELRDFVSSILQGDSVTSDVEENGRRVE